MFYNNRTKMFEGTGSREEGYVPQLHRMYYTGSDGVVLLREPGDWPVALEALSCSDQVAGLCTTLHLPW